jgi:hypothetical protein
MFQITLARAMAVILFVSIGLVALSRPSPVWASFVFTATLVALLSSLIGILARRGRPRLALAGFALFGWSHLAISFGPWPWLNNQGLRPPEILTNHMTRYVSQRWLSQYLRPNPANLRTVTKWNDAKLVVAEPSQLSFEAGIGPSVVITDSPAEQILRSLSSIFFGLLGAALSLAAAGRCDRPPGAPVERNDTDDG